jgi:predicted DNA-binding mobile mystery protein A
MKERKLILAQLDLKLDKYRSLGATPAPSHGWVHSIRQALNMSLRQLGNRMGITAPSVHEIEERERNGTVSLKVLRQVGEALDLKLVYGFIPRAESLEEMIENRAYKLAREIVIRTSISMDLENQKNSERRIVMAVEEKAAEIKSAIPRYLWD